MTLNSLIAVHKINWTKIQIVMKRDILNLSNEFTWTTALTTEVTKARNPIELKEFVLMHSRSVVSGTIIIGAPPSPSLDRACLDWLKKNGMLRNSFRVAVIFLFLQYFILPDLNCPACKPELVRAAMPSNNWMIIYKMKWMTMSRLNSSMTYNL